MEFTVTPAKVSPLGVPGVSWRDPKACFKRHVVPYNLKFWLVRPYGALREPADVPALPETQRHLKKHAAPKVL